MVWRPILAGKVSLGEVTRREVDLIHLLKLNSLLDMVAATEHRDAEDAKRRNR